MTDSIIKQLVAISLYKFTGNEIGELKIRNQKYADKTLPEFCITDKGRIEYTRYWLQFIENGKEEYYLFDVDFREQLINEEWSIEIFQDAPNEWWKKLIAGSYEWYLKNFIKTSTWLVFSLEYTSSFNGESTEYDEHTYLEGYLTGEMIYEKFE